MLANVIVVAGFVVDVALITPTQTLINACILEQSLFTVEFYLANLASVIF